tara:strand:- start:68118 stop:68642 length:525 start_codon:yes stop_codon:yes gene_type:complete
MKENIKIALLALLTVTMVYDVFIKDEEVTTANATKPSVVAKPGVELKPANNTPAPQPEKPKLASETRPKTTIQFNEMEHDFGDIYQDSKNEYVFKFKNTGNEPLIIENAVGSCGCTVPEYPKEPIKPGEEGEIKVVYSPGKQKAQQQKTVTITANTDPITTQLKIKANVLENKQ